MMEDNEHEELLIAKVAEVVEERLDEKEARRFRTLYIVLGAISFVGIGVVSQLVDFYSSRAVEAKLSVATQELDSAKTFAQLMSLATTLDLQDSFSREDRDTIVSLLQTAQSNRVLRREPAFASLLEKILRSFAASDNPLHVSKVVDMYEDECFLNPEIALLLTIHYGRTYLAHTDEAGSIVDADRARLEKAAHSISGGEAKPIGTAFSLLKEFKRNGMKKSEAIDVVLSSLDIADNVEKARFWMALSETSSPSRMAKKPTPEIQRVAHVAERFIATYKAELDRLIPNELKSMDEESSGEIRSNL